MSKGFYINIDESTPAVAELIEDTMFLIDTWVKTVKTPIPKKKIRDEMRGKGKTDLQINYVINLLIKRGFIREAISVSNIIKYVQTGTMHAYQR